MLLIKRTWRLVLVAVLPAVRAERLLVPVVLGLIGRRIALVLLW